MLGSKENARLALRALLRLRANHEYLGEDRQARDSLNFIEKFLRAAERRLKSEIDIRAGYNTAAAKRRRERQAAIHANIARHPQLRSANVR